MKKTRFNKYFVKSGADELKFLMTKISRFFVYLGMNLTKK